MAREILFKAKRTDNGEWVEGSLITGVFCRLGQDIPYIFCPKEADYDCFEDFSEENGIFEAQPDTICQYTGLTDKNGKKIWEKDVVKFPDCGMSTESGYGDCFINIGSIAYDTESMSYFITDRITVEMDDIIIKEEVEVIGNIFDNPELLGGGEC